MRGRISAATTVCMAIVAAGMLADVKLRAQATAPSGETVLDNYVKAVGGLMAFDKLNTRVVKARLEIPAAGISMAVTAWAARPNKARMLVEADVVGRVERGFDGTVGWELATTSGPRIIDGAQLDDLARDSRFDGLATWRDWVAKAETIGAADVDGKPVWKVVVTPKRGSPQTCFFDQASSLLVKLEMTMRTPAGDIPVESFPGDYRDVDGIRMPHRTRQVIAGQERVAIVESVTHNAEMPVGQFDPPKEVQALFGKKVS
jgi:hypothetical protein